MTDRSRQFSQGRTNQKRRTREALLQAAMRLVAAGETPSIEDVAEEALVSRTTAYRYFPSADALIGEAFFERAIPAPETLFEEPIDGVLERVLYLEEKLNGILFEHEVSTHVVVRNIIDAWLVEDDDGPVIRAARRLRLIDAALEPVAAELGPKRLARLRNALALTIGAEAVIVTRDVCGLDVEEAREVARWATEALVLHARDVAQ